ncbi:MAG: sn-glycerol-3-phosphate ABC transporter ATP-binding protein UgpC [Betaproteobacteria bacterium]
MASLSLRGIVKRFAALEVVHGVDLDIAHGEFVVFVGPSGCGKTTLLRMIAGLEEITDGELCIDGVRVNEVAPARRKIAMVFQSYALYPHMSVYDNLAFGLQTAGEKKEVIDRRVRQVAQMLKIDAYLARKPKALSGGQRQRVAIGRAIAREPKLFLFDEPLSNLDAELRVQMRVELSKLHAELGVTMIYVTHDQVEAMTMADRIVVLKDGRIEQAGTPLELYNRPANRFVAGFIGSPKMNFLDGVAGGRTNSYIDVRLPGSGTVSLPTDASGVVDGTPICIGIRPEHVELADGGLPMTVTLIEQLGGNTVLYGSLGAQQTLVVQVVGQSGVSRGDTVGVRLPPECCHGFGADGLAIATSRSSTLQEQRT